MRIQFKQCLHQARLSSPTGSRYDKQVSGVIHKRWVFEIKIKQRSLFYVLNLLSHLLNQHFHVHRNMGEFKCCRF